MLKINIKYVEKNPERVKKWLNIVLAEGYGCVVILFGQINVVNVKMFIASFLCCS